jgi:hypothetical protein
MDSLTQTLALLGSQDLYPAWRCVDVMERMGEMSPSGGFVVGTLTCHLGAVGVGCARVLSPFSRMETERGRPKLEKH